MDLSFNLSTVRTRIAQACARVGRDPKSVKLLAVTKAVSDDVVAELLRLGISSFGENRVQQGRKRAELFPQADWHLIGSLQTNKVKHCQDFSLIHSLDRLKLAEELNSRAVKWQKSVDVLIQVNISREASKHGLPVEKVCEFAKRVTQEFEYLNLCGLMGMAPFTEPEKTRNCFRELADLQQELKVKVKPDLEVLSMGMSNDFEVAVEEGSTLVRIGSALFKGEV
ncbi:MAG: YggS family pyridoxal phosphate-dependent enzyme [Firmicutes bacterium]|nr:YggS family pyridoxal phosphate-dependent enzyme [Bacillota bacterium]